MWEGGENNEDAPVMGAEMLGNPVAVPMASHRAVGTATSFMSLEVIPMRYGPDHPMYYRCPKCGALEMQHCRSVFGRIIKGYERMHSARHKLANQYVHGL